MAGRHFDWVAGAYDRYLPYSGPEPLLALLQVRAGHRVLDLGGGTGRVSSTFGCHCLLVVADASWPMTRQAQRKGLAACAAEAEQLPFPDGAFDRLVMVDAFHHLADQSAAAREVVRVLAPGGLAVVEEPDIQVPGVRCLALAERLALMRSRFFSAADMARIFREAGARHVEVHRQPPNVRLVVAVS